MSAGTNHSCGVTTEGNVYYWGDNSSGQLGDGTTMAGHIPVPVTFTVLQATHPLMADAVRNALPAMRFVPAQIGGEKVRQIVLQSFVFRVGK